MYLQGKYRIQHILHPTFATSVSTRAVNCTVGKIHAPILYPQRLKSSAMSLPNAEFEILAISRVYMKRRIMGYIQLVRETDGQVGRNETLSVETANDQDWKAAE